MAVHIAVLAAAAVVVPGATARIQDVINVDLVAVEPPPRVVEAPPAPPAPKPKPLTLPKPIVAPPPKIEEPRQTSPPPQPEPAQAPTPPPAAIAAAPAATPPTPAPATPIAPATPPSALASAPAGPRALDPGVSFVENVPKASSPPVVASIPPGTGVTSVAQPRGGYQVRPSYPSSAKRLGVQGTTLLRVHVLEDGRVGGIDVEQSAGHPDLDQAATDAVRRWRFEPARRGEHPVAMWVRLPVEFRLK